MDKARFLENLRSERKKRDLTQAQAAEALGVSDKTYSKWETGENEPDIDTLCRLADFYEISPARFFREGDGPAPPEGLSPGEAGEACFRRINDLLLSLRSLPYPPPDTREELPVPEMPPELRMPDSEKNFWHFDHRDLMALAAAGPDLNLTLLMLPHTERYRWLTTTGDGLEAFFRFLGLPGAMKCLYAVLTEKPGSLFTPEYLAGKVGITAAEAEAVLSAGEAWQIFTRHPYYRAETPEKIYHGAPPVALMGLVSLARIAISADPFWGPRGEICSGPYFVNLPPTEKGAGI